MIYLLAVIASVITATGGYFLFRDKRYAIDHVCDFMEGASILVIGLIVALISALLRIAGIL